MAKCLISFPGTAISIPEDMDAIGEAAHAFMRDAKDAGVYVFGGGINEAAAPRVADHLCPRVQQQVNGRALGVRGCRTSPDPSTNPIWP